MKGWKFFFGANLFVGCLLVGLRPAWPEVMCDDATKRYHTETCPDVSAISKKNLKKYPAEAEAEAKGFYPCPKCVILPTGKNYNQAKQIRQFQAQHERNPIYYGDPEDKLYHSAWCPEVKKTGMKWVMFKSVNQAGAAGYLPCKECNPPVIVKKQDAVPTPGRTDKKTATQPPKSPAGGPSSTAPGGNAEEELTRQ